MSRYVQRCTHCRNVRGKTAFPVLRGGGRAAVCRWCLDDRVTRLKLARERTRLQARRDELRRQLAVIERRLSVLAVDLDPAAWQEAS